MCLLLGQIKVLQYSDPISIASELQEYYRYHYYIYFYHYNYHYYYCYYIASCAIWLWNMVSYIKGGIQAKGI